MSLRSMIFFAKLFWRNIFTGKVTVYKLKALAVNLLFAICRIPRVKYGPAAMWVETANFCNLACDGCWVPSLSKKLTPGAMDFGLYKRLIDETHKGLIMIMLQMSGEPFLNKRMIDMMTYANEKKVIVWTSTNGSFSTAADWGEAIVQSGLDTIYFSISGTNQEDYEKYHCGGNLSLAVDNIKKIQDAKSKLRSQTPYIYLRALMTGKNDISIKQIEAFAHDLGVGLHIRTVHLNYVFDGLEDPGKTAIRISSLNPPAKVKNQCLGLWLAPAVASDGSILPCCLNHLGVPNFGNVKNTKFTDIWRSDPFNKFRKSMLTSRKSLGGCAYCCDNSIGFKDKFAEEKREIKITFYKQH